MSSMLLLVLILWPVATLSLCPWAWNAFDPIQQLGLTAGAAIAASLIAFNFSKSLSASGLSWAAFLPVIPLLVLPFQSIQGVSEWRIIHGEAMWAAFLLASLLPAWLGREEHTLLMRAWLGMGALESAIVLLQAAGIDPVFLLVGHFDGIWRIYGTLGNPNLVAALLVPLALLATDEELVPHSKIRFGLLAMMVCATVITGSRFGVIVLAILLLWRFVLLSKSVKSLWLALGVAAMLILIVFIVGQAMGKSMHSPLGRIFFWEVAARLIAIDWWPGHGWGSFGVEYPAGLELVGEGRAIPVALPVHAHNDWLEFGVEFGIPGLFLFFGIVVFLWVKTAQEPKPLILALWGSVLTACWTSPLHDAPTALFFWMMFGLLAAQMTKHSIHLHVSRILLTAIVLACSLGSCLAESRFQGHILAGQLVQNSDMEGNLAGKWEKAFEQSPMDGYFAFRSAVYYAFDGRLDRALELAKAATESYADFNLWKLQAWALAKSGCFTESNRILRSVQRHFPSLESINTMRNAIVEASKMTQTKACPF